MMKSNKAAKAASNISRWVIRIILILITIIMMYPLIWNVYSSFKTNTEFLENPFSFPSGLEWGNYNRAIVETNLGQNIYNSIYVVLVCLVIIMLCAVPCAYCLARFRFWGSKFMTNMYMAAIFIQATYIMIPLFLQMNQLNWLNKLTPLALLYAVMQFPFSIFLLSGFMRSISKEYEEAAMIDGTNYFYILTRIIIPMAKPGVITVCMLSAMAAWNEYPVALVMVTDPLKQTLPVGIARLYEIQRYATDWGALFAGLVMVLVPSVFIYVVGQKYLIQGINVGGVKG